MRTACWTYYETVGRGALPMVVRGGPGANHTYFLPYLLPLARHNKQVFVDERGGMRLALESCQRQRILGHVVRKEFQRYKPAQLDVFGPVYDAHSTTKLLENPVM